MMIPFGYICVGSGLAGICFEIDEAEARKDVIRDLVMIGWYIQYPPWGI